MPWKCGFINNYSHVFLLQIKVCRLSLFIREALICKFSSPRLASTFSSFHCQRPAFCGRREGKKKELQLLFLTDAVAEWKSKQSTNLAPEVKIHLCCNIHLHFLLLKPHLKCINWHLDSGRNTNMMHDQSKEKWLSECVRLSPHCQSN